MTYKPFKMKGSPMKRNFGVGSPNNLNNFGIGPGGSPWKNEDDEKKEDVDGDEKKEEDKVDEQGGDAEKADKPWVKALKIGTTLLSGGIQGVYGGTRQYPKINYGKKASVKDPIDNLGSETSGTYAQYLANTEDDPLSPADWEKLNKKETKKNKNVKITNINTVNP